MIQGIFRYYPEWVAKIGYYFAGFGAGCLLHESVMIGVISLVIGAILIPVSVYFKSFQQT